MKKTLLLKTMLLLCALVVGSVNGWADDYELYSGTITEGDYLIVYSGKAMKNTVSNSRLSYASVTPVEDVITTTDASIVWHISLTQSYARLYNAAVNKYAAGTGAANKAQLIESGTDDKSQWAVTGTSTYEFVNKYNKSESVNCNLRNNGTYGFACYSTSTGGALSLYKKKDISVTSLSVGTAPTKLNYKVGETLDLTGLVLDADGNDVTSGYTADPANGATLNTVGAQTVTFTYGGKSCTQTIHVGGLQSIALTTTGVKTTYNQGQTFDPENLVVKATFSDEEATPTSWEEEVTNYTFSPNGALETSDNEITINYTWNEVVKTATIPITVNAATAYTVTFNAGAGTCGTASLTEATGLAGVELPTATIDLTGWSFAGWAEAATANTEVAPTLYAAGDTYNPTEDCTLYAVYKFSEGTENQYKRATSVSEITSAGKVVIVSNKQSKMLDNTLAGNIAAPSETEGNVTAATKDVFTVTGNSTDGYSLRNGSLTIGVTGTSDNTVLSNTSTNSTWTINAHNTTNAFYFENKAKSKLCLEHDGTNWCVYAPGTPSSNTYNCLLVYIPNFATVYNSNPAAIINPTVAWTTAGDKTLYVQNTNTYDNPATVTGISKTATYESSDETVASVSDAGVVTALKAGNATITAKVAAEAGVNTEATASYEVTVKDASNIAGLKAITSSSSAVSFTADLTDAVVTYVKGNHAYIQDASGAVYASCGSSLTAGKKISGPVSGSVKAANQIDEITAINLDDATLTDGDIPAAAVLTAAALAANKADYEGKLVQIANATVTASLENDNTSGGKISDDNKTTEINLYAPDSNIEALKDAEGTFNGYITLYGGSTIRFNIYEQSQITLTKNAPTAQTLSFDKDAVELDEVTDALTAFTGQTVKGASTTVTYSKVDNDNIIDDFNTSTGALTLTGACGTATITATAAAEDIVDGGVTTPYQEATKSYTITVYPRYIVTFSVNGIETTVRQAAHGEAITVPVPADINDYKFVGWSTSTVAATDDEPELASLNATITPENNNTKYYAVFAQETIGDDELVTLLNNTGSNATDATSGITVSGTINNNNGNSAPGFNMKDALTISNINLTNCKNPTSLVFDYKPAKSGSTYTTFVVKQYDSNNEVLSTTNIEGSTNLQYTTCDAIALDLSCTKIVITSSVLTSNCYIDNVKITATRPSISYYDYRTSLDVTEVTISDSKYLAFCYGSALNFSNTDVKAYTAKVDGGKVKLTQVDEVPAETGVVLYCATPGTYEIPVIASAAALSNNEMVGVLTRTQVLWESGDKYNYILQQGKFNMATDGYLKANRAYLSTEYDVTSAGARSMEIIFDDGEVTSIEDVRSKLSDMSGDFFDLQGRKVANPTKGLYIVNGKKVVVK